MKRMSFVITLISCVICFFTGCYKDADVIQPVIYNPKVTITSPINGSTVSEVVTVTCMATGSAAIRMVSLWVDGYPIAAASDTHEPFELRWNTASYQDSSVHTLVARALDANGNQMDSDPIQVSVDNSKARPRRLELRLIRYVNNTFQVRWPRSTDGDFYSYLLYQALSSDLSDEAVIYSSHTRGDTSYVVNGITQGEYRYYRLAVEDTLGLKTSSTMQTAGAFEILFSDEFDTPSSLLSWQIDGGTWTVENGQLVCRGYFQLPRDSFIRAGDTTWTDYEVSVVAYFDNGDANILLRSIGARGEHEYRVNMFPGDYSATEDPYKNKLGIAKEHHQISTPLLDLITPISNPAAIRVRIEGSQISVFVNNRLVGQANDPDPFTHGRFGLGVIWELQSRFDNVVVWKL